MCAEISKRDDLVIIEHLGDGVAKLVFNDPPLNLMTSYMNKCLDKALDILAKDSSVRVVVVTGAGDKAFSAGAHVKEFAKFVRAGSMIRDKLELECKVNEKLANLPQPTIAALHHIVLGGGIEVSLCCDYRVIGESVTIGYPEINLGLFPGGGGLIRLQDIVGAIKAKEMLMLGEAIDAKTAVTLGIANIVCADEDVLNVAIEKAFSLAKKPKEALFAIK